MTVKELNQLYYLEGMITKERERLQSLRDSIDVKAQVITDMPRSSGAKDRIGDTVPRIVDTERELEENIAKYSEQREHLLRYINRTPNVRIRMILILRFIDQKSWQTVANEIGGKETEYSVKAACYRYVENREDPPDAVPGQVSLFE